MSDRRIMYAGTVEYLGVTITADVTLDTQPVAVSFDRATWNPATWTGSAGLVRTAHLLIGDDVPLPEKGTWAVYARVTDNPEAPIVEAGVLEVR